MKQRQKRKNLWTMLLLCVLVCLCIPGVYAYMVTRSQVVESSMTQGVVECVVQDNQTINVRENVKAYVRSTVVVNYENDQNEIRGIAPVAGVDYSISVSDSWQMLDGVYYYYMDPVAPNTVLASPFAITPITSAPEGFHLSVKVLAEAIQSSGTTDSGNVAAVTDAWGITGLNP